MEKVKPHLTNEVLSKMYNDNFSLALAAMTLAEHMIHSGKDVTLTELLDLLAKSGHKEHR